MARREGSNAPRARSAAVLLVVLLLAAVAGCTGGGETDNRRQNPLLRRDDPPGEPGDPPRSPRRIAVAATHPVLGDLARLVGGRNVAVHDLVKAGIDPHALRPTPADVDAVAKAELLLTIGRGLEPWLDRLRRDAGGSARVVDTTTGIPARAAADGGPDPYVWLDPANGKLLVEAVRAALTAVDPADADAFRVAAERQVAVITKAEDDLGRILAPLPGRPIVTAKASLGWLAARYRLDVVGSVIPSPDGRAAVTTEHLTELRRIVGERRVAVVFGESTVREVVPGVFARDAGIPLVGGPDSLLSDSLGRAGGGADHYTTALLHTAKELAARA